MFQHKPAFRLKVLPSLADDLANVLQSVLTSRQCGYWLEAQIALAKVRIVFGDIRRVADDDIEGLPLQCSKPVAQHTLHIIRLEVLRIFLGYSQRGG